MEITSITDNMLQDISSQLSIRKDQMCLIKYSQNFVYSIQYNDNERILRITSNFHRTRKQIEAELNWIMFLADSGLNTCKPVESKNGFMITTIDFSEDSLHCVIFEKANGRKISGTDLNKELFNLHGMLTGKIHKLTKAYPTNNLNDRFVWNENRLFTSDPCTYLPPGVKEKIVPVINSLLSEAAMIPKTADSYGMLHGDLNYENFFINSKQLEVFDFDNCCNGYFIYDIAKSLYASIFTYLRSKRTGDRTEFDSPKVDMNLEEVWGPFWYGYRTENDIMVDWFEQIPLFFEIIHVKEFVHHYRRGVPYRSEELKKIFQMEEDQIVCRNVPVHFDFVNGKTIKM